MRFSLIICLISGLLLIHAGATVHYLLGEMAYINMTLGAEEEEEVHFPKKLSKVDNHVNYSAFFVSDSEIQLSEVYSSSVECNYEANRVDLPPEL